MLLPVGNSLLLVPGNTNFGIGTPNYDGVQIFTGTGDWIRFGHMAAGNSFTDRMVITASGRVGIGTTAPYNKLTVNGGISGTPSWNNSTVELMSTGGLTTSLAFHRAGYSISCIYSDDGSLAFQVGGGEKIRITPYNTGFGTSSPNPSAIVDLTSTTQGFLPPRMSDAEMNSISSPATGLMVWNNDIVALFVFDGWAWKKIAYA
jgi:hypothetical protein